MFCNEKRTPKTVRPISSSLFTDSVFVNLPTCQDSPVTPDSGGGQRSGGAPGRVQGCTRSSCLASPSQLCFLVSARAVNGCPFRGLVGVACFPCHVYAGVSLFSSRRAWCCGAVWGSEPKRLLVPWGRRCVREAS